MKVLIVDDQSFIRELLKNKLSELGDMYVMEAANGNEALGKAKVGNPDIIFMDIVMPNKDGIEALKEIRANEKTANIPVFIISSYADDEHKRQVMEAGATMFIDKAQLNVADIVGKVKATLHI